MQKTRLVIAGIGGVGGYFGGMLAKHYNGSSQVEIIFLARGNNYQKLKTNGIRVVKGSTEFTVRPFLVTDNPAHIGPVDIVIICTKTYHLKNILQQLKPCITPATLILPLLNGVNAVTEIEQVFPNANLINGCVYIVARLKEPAVVENSGNIEKLFFGSNGAATEQICLLDSLMTAAGIDCKPVTNIDQVVWEKFVFISPTATASSYFDACIGEILEDPNKLEAYTNLIKELLQLSKCLHIDLPANIIELTLDKIKKLPYATTSSMHSDFKNGNALTELDALTGYVVDKAKLHKTPAPTYNLMYKKLKA